MVVEIPSPRSQAADNTWKLADYFRVPSIQHHLVVGADGRMVIHHRREAEGRIGTQLLSAGTVILDPPGLTLAIEALYDNR